MTEPTAPTVTSDFSGFLSPEMAAPYFQQARSQSVLMSLGRQVALGANGIETPVTTTRAQAQWVSEAGRKKSSKSGVGLKTMKPHKIAAIAVVSAEVVRANPANYIQLFKDDVAESMAIAFDAAGFHGTSSPFDANIDGAAIGTVNFDNNDPDGNGVYDFLLAGIDAVKGGKNDSGRKFKLTGFVFDDLLETRFLGAKDANDRPLWVDSPFEGTALNSGRLLNRRALLVEGIASSDETTVVGYGGDFSQVIWGQVGGISYDVSTEATVTLDGELVSLWENNLVAIRCEAEFGLLINTNEGSTNAGKAPFVKFGISDTPAT